jgi:hypothetical protein
LRSERACEKRKEDGEGMNPSNKRQKLTESLLGTTYEREDLMRQEARARRLARRRRREERSAEGDQRGSLVFRLGRVISSWWGRR